MDTENQAALRREAYKDDDKWAGTYRYLLKMDEFSTGDLTPMPAVEIQMRVDQLATAKNDGSPGGVCPDWIRGFGGACIIDRDMIAAICLAKYPDCDHSQLLMTHRASCDMYDEQYVIFKRCATLFDAKLQADIAEYRTIDWNLAQMRQKRHRDAKIAYYALRVMDDKGPEDAAKHCNVELTPAAKLGFELYRAMRNAKSEV